MFKIDKTDMNFQSIAVDNVINKKEEVNSPDHYTSGKFETIEMIEEVTKNYDNGYLGMCVGNAIKYLSRAPLKHQDKGLTDLKKAKKYLEFAIKSLEEYAKDN
ncbi:DUF3310 domain-containing protein [Paraliobacillus ryukyuensis]|uniref:DUF3310 domain-containing protein n=1 Tax=Paraliobacillus ryukyuensis TaxID=200904 RepID=UPI002118DF68|nr:DUF3310 domain-containing protein [Paraliobacillus ryukyuensis]